MFGSKRSPEVTADADVRLRRRDAALAALAPRVDAARVVLVPHLETARGRLVPYVGQAREAVGPTVARAGETLRETVVPVALSAYEARKPATREAARRSAAAWEALRGAESTSAPAPRRWPLALLFLGIGAALGAVAGMFTRRRDTEPQWTPTAVSGTAASSGGWMSDVAVVDGEDRPGVPADETVVDLTVGDESRAETRRDDSSG